MSECTQQTLTYFLYLQPTMQSLQLLLKRDVLSLSLLLQMNAYIPNKFIIHIAKNNFQKSVPNGVYITCIVYRIENLIFNSSYA